MEGVEDLHFFGRKLMPYGQMYNQCADGDDLYWEESPIDSEYESFALTCGGRDCDITTLRDTYELWRRPLSGRLIRLLRRW